MLINPFLIVLIVILRCRKKDSSVINLTYSEQQLFSHRYLNSQSFDIKTSDTVTREYWRGKYHCTIDLLFDWFGIIYMTTDNFCFYLQNRLIQTSQTGGQWYCDTSPFSIHCSDTASFNDGTQVKTIQGALWYSERRFCHWASVKPVLNGSLCWESLCWVPLYLMPLYWVSLFCWVSFGLVSLWWVSLWPHRGLNPWKKVYYTCPSWSCSNGCA